MFGDVKNYNLYPRQSKAGGTLVDITSEKSMMALYTMEKKLAMIVN